MDYKLFLLKLADELDGSGRFDLADLVDENLKEFLELLESGKIDFDFLYSGGQRPKNDPYGNRGKETPLCGIDGIQ